MAPSNPIHHLSKNENTTMAKITLRNGDMLMLNNVAYTIAKLDLNAGKVIGAWLSKAPSSDDGGDIIAGSTEGVYLTARMLRQRLS